MPNFDKTGPNGQGAGTGRKAGKCFQNSQINEQQEQGSGFGRGRRNQTNGRGMGRGNGLGRGLGRNR